MLVGVCATGGSRRAADEVCNRRRRRVALQCGEVAYPCVWQARSSALV